MADLSITAANVVPGAGASLKHGTAGATIAAGKVVYFDEDTGKWDLADNNAAAADAKVPHGFAVNSASLNQPITVQKSGDLALGAVLTAGVAYYLSDTPGGVCPVADVGSGETSVLLGIAKSTSVLGVDIQASGVTL